MGGLLRPDPGSISVNGIDARRFSDTQADDRLDSRQTDGFVVILDEPFTGLDAASARQIKTVPRERLRDRDTVIMITHILEVAERLADLIGNLADLIGNMVGDRLIMQGTLEELHGQAGNSCTSLEDTFFALIASRTVTA